jgi:hypothetical protein
VWLEIRVEFVRYLPVMVCHSHVLRRNLLGVLASLLTIGVGDINHNEEKCHGKGEASEHWHDDSLGKVFFSPGSATCASKFQQAVSVFFYCHTVRSCLFECF